MSRAGVPSHAGLLCAPDGCPVAIAVFAGNTGDPATLTAQVAKRKQRFGLDHVVLVGDRGMILKVIQHLRPKLSCRSCETIVQAPMPSLPIERGRPGPGLIAHVVVSKYCDHAPLHRQSVIHAREGVELDRATLADWVGKAAFLLAPLAEAIGRHVRAGAALHADDTTVPVLAPGNGKTKTGRLWVVVRDERPWGSDVPPAAFYRYSSDRKCPATINTVARIASAENAPLADCRCLTSDAPTIGDRSRPRDGGKRNLFAPVARRLVAGLSEREPSLSLIHI